MTGDPAAGTASRGRRFGRSWFSSSKEDEAKLSNKKPGNGVAAGNGSIRVQERVKELERAKGPEVRQENGLARAKSTEALKAQSPGDVGGEWTNNGNATTAQTTTTTTTTTTNRLQKRQSKASSLFDMFSKPKVERAKGHSEGAKLESIIRLPGPMPPPIPLAQPHPRPENYQSPNASGTAAPMPVRQQPTQQQYVTGHPYNGGGRPPSTMHMQGPGQPQYHQHAYRPQNIPPPYTQPLQFSPSQQQQQQQLYTLPPRQVSAPQLQTRQAPSKLDEVWDPPPLFQSYPQAEKHGKLQGTNVPTEALIRANQIRREAQEAGNGAAPGAEAPSGGRGRLKRLSVMTGSYADAAPDVVDKVFVLVTAGRLVQYAGGGSSERMPEKVLRLGAGSAAFVCDLIPGKHWVVQVVQNASDVGPAGYLVDSVEQSQFPSNATVKPSRSLLSRIRQSTMGISSRGRNVNSLLLVFPNPDEMAGWLTAVRETIERLGGKKRGMEDPEMRRERDKEASEAAQKRLSQQQPLSHRFQVQHKPERLGEAPANPLYRQSTSPPVGLNIAGDALVERHVSVRSNTSSRNPQSPVSPLMSMTPTIPERNEETASLNSEEPTVSTNGSLANSTATSNTSISAVSDVSSSKPKRLSLTPATMSSPATNSSLSPDLLRLEPLKETSRFSSTSTRTSRTFGGSELDLTPITAATSVDASPVLPPSPQKEPSISPPFPHNEPTDSPRLPLLKSFPLPSVEKTARLSTIQMGVAQPRQQTSSLAARRSKAPQPINLDSMTAQVLTSPEQAATTTPLTASTTTTTPAAKRVSITVLPTNKAAKQDGSGTPRFVRPTLIDVPKSPRSPRLTPMMLAFPGESVPEVPSVNPAFGEGRRRPASTVPAAAALNRADFGGAGARRSYFRPVPIPVRPSVVTVPTRSLDGKGEVASAVTFAKASARSTASQLKTQQMSEPSSRSATLSPKPTTTANESLSEKGPDAAMDIATRLQQIDADITRRLSRIKEQEAQEGGGSSFHFDGGSILGRPGIGARATSRASVVPLNASIPESPSDSVPEHGSRPPSRTILHSRDSLVVTPSVMAIAPAGPARRNSGASGAFSRSESPALTGRIGGVGPRLSNASMSMGMMPLSPAATGVPPQQLQPGKLRRPASVQIRADPAPFLSSRRTSTVNQNGPVQVGARTSTTFLNRNSKPLFSTLQASFVAEAAAAAAAFEERHAGLAHGRTVSKDLTTLAALSGPPVTIPETLTIDTNVPPSGGSASNSATTRTASPTPSSSTTMRGGGPGALRSSSSSPILHTPTASTASMHSTRLSESTKTIAEAIASDLHSIRQHQHKISLSSRSVTPTLTLTHTHSGSGKQHTLKSSVSSIDLTRTSSSRRSSVLLASIRPLSPPPNMSLPPPTPGTTITVNKRASRGSLTIAQAETLRQNLDAALAPRKSSASSSIGEAPATAAPPPVVAPVPPQRNPSRPGVMGRSASAASLASLPSIAATVAAVAGPTPAVSAPKTVVVGGVGRGVMMTLPPRMPPPDCPLPRLPASLIGQ